MEIKDFLKASIIYAVASIVFLLIGVFEPLVLGGYLLGLLIGSSILASSATSFAKACPISLAIAIPLVLLRIFAFPAVGSPENALSYENAMWLLGLMYHVLFATGLKYLFVYRTRSR